VPCVPIGPRRPPTRRQEPDRGRLDPLSAGLEGVVAFETEIAEPDKEGSALRYRGVDIEELVGSTSFGNVWGPAGRRPLRTPGCRPPSPFPLPVHSGDIRVDVQSAVAMLAPPGACSRCSDVDASRSATTWPGCR
jgi:citrate synthase